MDTIIEKHDEALSILRAILTASKGTIEEEAVLEDILPNPINTVEDVEDFSCRLDDESFRKKTVLKLHYKIVQILDFKNPDSIYYISFI